MFLDSACTGNTIVQELLPLISDSTLYKHYVDTLDICLNNA